MPSQPLILVVDDDPTHRLTAMLALRQNGYDALDADGVRTALDLARARTPDLILSDIHMDGDDGFSLVARLRAEPALANIPVILMTGEASFTSLRQGMGLGADDYLPKPYTVETLIQAVRGRLERVRIQRRETESRLSLLRGQISSMLPHELLTPLTGVLGIADLILADAGHLSAAEMREYAEMLRSSGLRLHKIILKFLGYAQVELLVHDPEARQNLRRMEVEHSREVITRRAVAAAEEAGRPDDLRLDLAPVSLAFGPDHLEMLVNELVENAFKFSPRGTPVELRTFSEDGRVVLTLSDQGRGMNPEDQLNIEIGAQFSRKFSQQSGPGLGLALTRRLVELHGGEFALQSRPNQGTTITITFAALPHDSSSQNTRG